MGGCILAVSLDSSSTDSSYYFCIRRDNTVFLEVERGRTVNWEKLSLLHFPKPYAERFAVMFEKIKRNQYMSKEEFIASSASDLEARVQWYEEFMARRRQRYGGGLSDGLADGLVFEPADND